MERVAYIRFRPRVNVFLFVCFKEASSKKQKRTKGASCAGRKDWMAYFYDFYSRDYWASTVVRTIDRLPLGGCVSLYCYFKQP